MVDDSDKNVTRNNPTLELIFYKIPMGIIGSLILTGIAINFTNVVSRHIFRNAIFWAEEILIFIVVWSVFIGIIPVAWRGGHLKMDLLSTRLKQPWKQIINGFMLISLIVFSLFAILQSIEVVALVAGNSQVSVTAEVPMFIPHSAILIGFLLMLVAVIIRARSYLNDDFEQ